MSRKYKNPPIVEAVCEFRLLPDTNWDLTLPGLIYEKIQDQFPNKEQRIVQDVQLIQEEGGLKQEIRTTERILFLNEDRKVFVQVGKNLLAVHCLAPYPEWVGFKPSIGLAYRTLSELVEVKGIQRIGLRFINRVEIPSDTIDLDEYFEFRPYLSPQLPQTMHSMLLGCELPFHSKRDICKIQLAMILPDKPNTSAFLLDIDYYLSKSNGISPGDALEWVEHSHENIESVFEGCISDRLREIFLEVK